MRLLQHEGVSAPVDWVRNASRIHLKSPQHASHRFGSTERESDSNFAAQTGGQVPRHAVFLPEGEEALEIVIEGSTTVHDTIPGELFRPQSVQFPGGGVRATTYDTIVNAACDHHQVNLLKGVGSGAQSYLHPIEDVNMAYMTYQVAGIVLTNRCVHDAAKLNSTRAFVRLFATCPKNI